MNPIKVSSELVYDIQTPSSFSFSVAPAYNAHQTVYDETIILNPPQNYSISQIGNEGNRIFRLQAGVGPFSLNYQATVKLHLEADQSPQINEINYGDLPDEVLSFLNPSRYCESDRLARFALQEFGELDPGFSRVSAICDWINDRLDYVSGTTDVSSSACDVFIQRTGVCRDYAHLAITLCRALCIPARYVSGYAVDLVPPDFHGFFEAFLGDRWYLFDATKMAPTNGLVRIATGRDAADASFATIIGSAVLQSMNVSAQELPDDFHLELPLNP